MKTRRKVFALGYIDETLDRLAEVLSTVETDTPLPSEVQWAVDVLDAYFSALDLKHPLGNRAYKRFCAICQSHGVIENKEVRKVPFQPDPDVDLPDYDDLHRLCRHRHSVRWYKDRSVPRSIVDKAVSLAALSPSACNRQPFKFHILENPSDIQKVSELAGGTKGFSHNLRGLIALTGSLSAFPEERDRHLIYIDASLAAMVFVLGLESMGLGSCVINWPDIPARNRQISGLLGLRPYERTIMLISFGYPDEAGSVPYSEKKPLDQVCRYVSSMGDE